MRSLAPEERSILTEAVGAASWGYGLRLTLGNRLSDGEESEVYRVDADGRPLVLRIAPAWRRGEELRWAYERASEAQRTIPQVIAPLRNKYGDPLMTVAGGRPVSLFPFLEGRQLERDDTSMRDQAARLLAKLHRHFLQGDSRGRPNRLLETLTPGSLGHLN